MADEAGVPPYVIFSDRTLMEMAAYFPRSTESLLTISGVGQVKARQYGDPFLEVVRSYCEKHGIKEKRKETVREKSDANRRFMLVGEMYNSGKTVRDLAEQYRVTTATIVDHLTRYLLAGNALRMGADLASLTKVTPDLRTAAFSAFDEHGTALLRPIFEQLNASLDYYDLKVLRLIYESSRQGK